MTLDFALGHHVTFPAFFVEKEIKRYFRGHSENSASNANLKKLTTLIRVLRHYYN